MGFAKLFSSITESSLWSEDKDTRILFVTMLAKADAAGFVEASLPGLARAANLTLDEAENALRALESPDPHSKDLDADPDNEGRRIVKAPGGWVLVNYEAYRARRGEEERRQYMRDYMRKRRKGQSVNNGKQSVNNSKQQLAQAEAEAEAEAVLSKPPASQVENSTGTASKALEIYKAYPRKVGKARALQCIERDLRAGTPSETILEAVRAFSKADSPKPHASTYFNQKRWQDEENGKDYDPGGFAKTGDRKTTRANPPKSTETPEQAAERVKLMERAYEIEARRRAR